MALVSSFGAVRLVKLVESHAVAGGGRLRLPEFIAGNVIALHDLVEISYADLRENHVGGAIELIDTVQFAVGVLVAEVKGDARFGIVHFVDFVKPKV